MIKLSTYIKILKGWITLFSYWVIKTLVDAYPTRKENGDYFFFINCLFYGTVLGLIACGIIEWFDFNIPFKTNESPLVNLDLIDHRYFDELNITKQTELKEFKSEEDPRKDVLLWLVVTLVIYSIVLTTFY
jgi:hypothetical protein